MDRSQGDGWWLASDGRWYPAESAPAPPPPPAPPAERMLGRGLTTWLQTIFFLAAAAAAAGAVVTVSKIERFDDFTDRGSGAALQRLVDAEDVSVTIDALFALAAITVAVLLIVWCYQAYKVIEKQPVVGRRWTPGWAIGGWFIPFANLVIPKLVVNEIDRITVAPPDGGWEERRTLALSNWWWGAWVVAIVVFTIGAGITGSELEGSSFDGDVYRAGLWLTDVGYVGLAVAGVLGSLTIRALGARFNPRTRS